MATQEQIELLLQQLKKAPPSQHFQSIDSSTAGMRAILLYLFEASNTVTAGMISDYMNVSTARVAVLLKKMAAKGLIAKGQDPADARKVTVRLSDQGIEKAAQVRKHIHAHVSAMIDKVSMERMMEFAAISQEIHSIVKEPEIDI